MTSTSPQVIVYTDGACSGNPGPGGWAALLMWEGREKALSGGSPETTNNKMELQAAIEALKALKKPCSVTIYTDSKYVLRGATEWLEGWKAKGWKTANKKPVENRSYWEELSAQLERHYVTFIWVKGHSGDPLNERVDALAVNACEKEKTMRHN